MSPATNAGTVRAGMGPMQRMAEALERPGVLGTVMLAPAVIYVVF